MRIKEHTSLQMTLQSNCMGEKTEMSTKEKCRRRELRGRKDTGDRELAEIHS